MSIKAGIILLGLMMNIAACKTSEGKVVSSSDSIIKIQEPLPVKKVILEKGFQKHTTDPVEIDSVSLDGVILTFYISYSGGCGEHNFSLYANDMFMKSLPPKAGMFLVHDSGEDMCESLIRKRIQFDISSYKYPDQEKDYSITISFNRTKETVFYSY